MSDRGEIYHLAVLGTWRLERDGYELSIRSNKARAILSFLAFTQQKTHLRGVVAGMLWPRHAPAQARASLRQALAEIRKATGENEPILDTDHATIRVGKIKLNTDVDLALDAISSCRHQTLWHDLVAYLPDVFSDFQSIGSGFEDWVEKLRTNKLQTATSHFARIYSGREFGNGIKLHAAQLAFSLDNYDEAAARAVMSTWATMNEISNAVRFYDVLYESFERELDIAPSLATQDLAAQIKMNLRGVTSETQPPSVSATITPFPENETNSEVSVAVLPFQKLGPVEIPDYVQLGLLDEITCTLAGMIAPSPISSNTMRRYLGDRMPRAADVHADTGARYVVSGSIRSDEKMAVVAVQMIDATNEKVFWADVYRRAHLEILDLESTIAANIVNAIVPTLHGAELTRTSKRSEQDLEPFQLVLRARDLISNLSDDTFAQAGRLLEIAIEKGQHFAPAYSVLADWYSVRIWQGWSENPGEDQLYLERHASTAINLQPSDGRTLAFLGHNRLIYSRRYQEAQEYFDRALCSMPNDSQTLSWTVPGLTYNGHSDQAIENGERALKLSPFDTFRFRNQHFLSIAHYAAENYDRAADLGLLSFEDNKTYVSNLRFTIASLFAAGRRDTVQELVDHHKKLEPNFRVGAFISRHPFRSDKKRHQYGEHLIAAGLKA